MNDVIILLVSSPAAELGFLHVCFMCRNLASY